MSLVKPLRGIGLVLFLLFMTALSVLVYLRRSGMPSRIDDHILEGLDAEVTVRFDQWAVPHVNAANDLDLFRAMGWLHANDRLTQMELGRRAIQGRLSELVGEPGVQSDVYFLTLRFPELADRLWQSASADSKRVLEAYAEGVNGWILERKRRVTPGLKMLGAIPDPWTPQDSLGFALLMAQDLSFWDQRPEEERFQWLRAFGADGLRDLLNDPNLHIPASTLALAEDQASAKDRPPEPIEEGDPASPGSNNWAIGGSRTATGKALLANDPHLGLFLPSIWYQIQLRGPGYEAAGMSLPGAPGVVIGRGPEVAWAFTNTMLDDHDVFFEQVNDQGQVRRDDQWVDVSEETLTLRLRGDEEHTFTRRGTDIGPLLDADPERGLPARSLAWTAQLPADPIQTLLRVPMAATPEDLEAAIEGYACPAQNLVAAFADGELMFTVLGRVPDRKLGDGRLPAPAWDSAYGWNGARPRSTNPTVVQPVDDMIVTANHDIRPAGYGLPLTAEFFSPFRADRIRQRLETKNDWQREDFARMQMDAVSLFALDLIAVAKAEAPFEGDAQSAFDLLSSWNGEMSLKGAPALFALFERELSKRIFQDEAEAAGLKRSVAHRDRVHRILHGKMDPRWLDDVSTDAVEDRKQILQASLAAAWRRASELWPGRSSRWDYGWLHSLRLNHRLDAVPLFGRWSRRGPYPVPGSSSTILALGHRWRDDGRQQITYGPSMRWIVDWSEPDKAWAVIPGGQSGHPSDSHYDDQVAMFLEGKLHEAPWSEERIDLLAVHELSLLPAR